MDLDCQRCGACCVNPAENRDLGYVAYVAINPGDRILRRKDLVKKLVVIQDGGPHLRLTDDGRCAALRGSVGRAVSCSIYHFRPGPCRRVEAGSRACLRYREAFGLDEG